MTFLAEEIAGELDEEFDDEIALLRQLVEIETPTFDTDASARIAEVIDARFTKLGARVEHVVTSAGTNLVIDAGTEGPAVLCIGHTDTVWPVGTIESVMPWTRVGDRITGPGIYDMKSGIVVLYAALRRLTGSRHRAVRIVLVCDEEVGSPTTQLLLREQAREAAYAFGFESPHPDGALKVGRRGSTRLRLSVTGRASHAALDPELGVSAIDELVDQLLRVREITTAPDLGSQVLCNVGKIAGGELTNVVPEHASADIGLRFMDPAAETRVLNAIHTLAPMRDGAVIACELLSHRPTWEPSEHDFELLGGVRSAAGRIDLAIDGRPASGAGDTNLLGSLGIPTLDGFGPRGGGAHARGEHILVSSLRERIELLTEVLQCTHRA